MSEWLKCWSFTWCVILGKGRCVIHAPQDSSGGCSSPFSRPWACRWRTTNVCVTWPVQCQTYGYVPSRKASPPFGWYQNILLGDRGTCVLTTCPGLHLTAGRLGFEPATYWSQVQHPTAMPPSHSTRYMVHGFNSRWHLYESLVVSGRTSDHSCTCASEKSRFTWALGARFH